MECELAFRELKATFVQGPILIPLDWIKEFHVHIDAFGTMIKAILTQGQKI
jgi:hypothetical protein